MEAKSNGGGIWSIYTGENIMGQIPTEEQWGKLSKILDFKKPYSEVNFVFNTQMGLTNVWSDINFQSEKRHHSTQKPVVMIERIIYASSNEGMIVLDPFLGSGSTAIAAKRLNRHYIGVEIDKEYCKIAKTRLSDPKILTEQKKLF